MQKVRDFKVRVWLGQGSGSVLCLWNMGRIHKISSIPSIHSSIIHVHDMTIVVALEGLWDHRDCCVCLPVNTTRVQKLFNSALYIHRGNSNFWSEYDFKFIKWSEKNVYFISSEANLTFCCVIFDFFPLPVKYIKDIYIYIYIYIIYIYIYIYIYISFVKILLFANMSYILVIFFYISLICI